MGRNSAYLVIPGARPDCCGDQVTWSGGGGGVGGRGAATGEWLYLYFWAKKSWLGVVVTCEGRQFWH